MSETPKILSTATCVPAHRASTAEILAAIERHLQDRDERFRKKVLRIFRGAGVEQRHSVMPAEQVLGALSFEERNAVYVEAVQGLAEDVLRKALDQAGLRPDALDVVITVSCTGFMIPSVDAHLVNRLGLRRDVVRLPVTEMGCAAGVSGMIYANGLLRGSRARTAAVVAVESPMSTFRVADYSMANMVSAATFGDGAACALVGYDEDAIAPSIVDTEMYHFYDETGLMGFRLRDTGFEMVLEPEVPERIEAHLDSILAPLLERNALALADIDHLIFHPGGKKILQLVERRFESLGKDLMRSRAVLRDYGNMSSATVLFVLDRLLSEGARAGDRGIMLSFGPGFSAQSVLLEWR